jgi:hypothetical protein
MSKALFDVSNWKLFFLISCFVVSLSFLINYLFLTDELYYQTFGEQIAIDRITKMLEFSEKWQWLGYAFIPILILIRVNYTAICLYSWFFIANQKARFKDLFKIALLADFIFVLAGLAKLVILIFFKEVNTLDDLQFQPLSLMELFSKNSVDAIFLYLLSLISVFELLYWLALAWLLTGVVEKPFGSSLKIVASSYGTGLLFWVLFVMFLTINMT